jgi:hypothetical protein
MRMREDAERSKLFGIKGNEKYEELKSNMLHNKIKTHEYQENSKLIRIILTHFVTEKITEIKRNNQHLLDKLLVISKGKQCTVN